MPRVSELGPDHLPADLQDIYHRYGSEYGPFGNQAKIFAHRPPALRHVMGLLLELADEQVLPKRYLEIAIVVVSKLNECEYCVAHHVPRLTEQGFDPAASDLILADEVPGFDDVDMLVRDYAVQVTENRNICAMRSSRT